MGPLGVQVGSNKRTRPPYFWRFRGGELCLDFVNTAGSRLRVPGSRIATRIPEDRLYDYERLIDWARVAGLVKDGDASQFVRRARLRPAEATRVWRRAVRLREALCRLGASAIEGVSPRRADLDILNAEFHVACGQLRIASDGKMLRQLWNEKGTRLDGMLWPVALSAVGLFIEGPVDRLKKCPGVGCAWLFIDGTKNRRRVWCSMSDCGNRSKVRRYRSQLRKFAKRKERP